MTTIEAARTPTTRVTTATEDTQVATRSENNSTAFYGINPTIVEAKSKAGGSSPVAATPAGGTQAAEQMVDAVVTIVVALIDVVISVLSLIKEKSPPSTKDPVRPKPIPLLPNKKPTPATKPGITPAKPPISAPAKRLEAVQDDKGVVTVRTSDGYVVKAEGKEAAWTIAGPDGKVTRVFGDPHVLENDGDRWDFKQRGTFVFGANKVTVETVPFGNGMTVSSRITLYSGGERVTIGGIDKNKPTILALAGDGRQHDDALGDGDIYTRASTKTGESWLILQNGKKKVMGAR